MIEISSDMVISLVEAVASIISQLWPVTAVLYGIVIAFFVGRKLVNLFPTK